MLRLSLVLAALTLAVSGPSSQAAENPDSVYAPLWLYNGVWHVSKKDLAAGAKPDELLNQCALIGRYFACQQTVNGSPSELLVFVPTAAPGKYYTQTVMPDGRAGGRGDLSINGDTWIYTSNWNQGGKTTFYKTTNLFSGKTRIHYDQQESDNNKDWKTTGSGDEVRVSSGHMTIAH